MDEFGNENATRKCFDRSMSYFCLRYLKTFMFLMWLKVSQKNSYNDVEVKKSLFL